MKEALVEILSVPEVGAAERGWASVFTDLVKARLTTLVLLTTLAGFYMGSPGVMSFTLMLNTLMATAFV
ncbi:MAG TPA: hypothetical protein VMA13_11600, partial [Candidatus Saccharimonadales bacterium]|nr:hypothetical protein [Candidatus Saccharimonadales bacterium]